MTVFLSYAMSDSDSPYGDLLTTSIRTNMRLSPPTVSPSDRVSIVVDLMLEEDVGAVIVVEDDSPIGIITEKDVLDRVIKPQMDQERTLVYEVMSKPLITIESDRLMNEALELMRVHNIRRLVVTENGVLSGITTKRRMLEVAHERYLLRNYRTADTALSYLSRIRVAYLSTYPPRECGIATYTKDLVDAISRLYILNPPVVLAVNDRVGYYNYEGEVRFQIDRERVETFSGAADYINDSDLDVVNLQHEFGLFGGTWGRHVLSFLERLEKPIITTLHTVLLDPDPTSRKTLEGILQLSDNIVVMARVGIKILEQLYDTLADKVRYIPHGCPNVPFISSATMKHHLGLEDRIIISTFGLLSRGKGLEYAIQAMPTVVKEEPNVLYLIIGETHPEVRKHEGETYRNQLINLVESLGVEENVRFVNRFLPKNELIRNLQATDIYVIPYPNREQISSGTLLYALSTGKAIISTPFLHAEEVMEEGCAMRCEFKDPDSIADCIMSMLKFDDMHQRFEERAYRYSREMIWPNVAMRYANLFYKTLGM